MSWPMGYDLQGSRGPQPGWFPDPASSVLQYRYWDGFQWTQWTQPIPRQQSGDVGVLFGRRFLGYLIDALVVSSFAVGLVMMLLYLVLSSIAVVTVIAGVVSVVTWFCYQYICIARSQATLGMRVVSMRVESTEGNIESAAVRRGIFFALISAPTILAGALIETPLVTIGSTLSTVVQLVFWVSCFALLWNKPPRAMHDNWTKTSVVLVTDQYGQRPKFFRRDVAAIWVFVAIAIAIGIATQVITIIHVFNIFTQNFHFHA